MQGTQCHPHVSRDLHNDTLLWTTRRKHRIHSQAVDALITMQLWKDLHGLSMSEYMRNAMPHNNFRCLRAKGRTRTADLPPLGRVLYPAQQQLWAVLRN
jgi:hypothetical protein